MKNFICILLICIVPLLWWEKISAASIQQAVGVNKDTTTKSHILPDGITIALHYKTKELAPYHADVEEYTDRVLQYATIAYNEIVYTEGFNAPGFTFANPDKDYCYDIDRTIDIYIAKAGLEGKGLGGFNGLDFVEAPCYDIIEHPGRAYDAAILFPADYRRYLAKNGEEDLTEGRLWSRMKASLFHEIFHLVSYSYNKNIYRWYSDSNELRTRQGGDWYVEGLARYIETLACSYDNFFSAGWVRESGKKRILSQSGANFLMQNPSEALRDARYDYCLFWAYIHKRYGMGKIEEISRRFRFITESNMSEEMPAMLSKVLGENFRDVLGGFAIAMYFKYFNPDIREGLNELRVMSLEDFSVNENKEMPSWSSNFITVNLEGKQIPAAIYLKKLRDKGELRMNLFARFQDGKIAPFKRVTLDRSDTLCEMNIHDLKDCGVKELILILTNANPDTNIAYRIIRT